MLIAAPRFSVDFDVRFAVFFFFSSRRRHTILQGDWSSDVCFPIYLGLDDLLLRGAAAAHGYGVDLDASGFADEAGRRGGDDARGGRARAEVLRPHLVERRDVVQDRKSDV